MSVPVRSALRSTLLCAVVPAAIVYAVALIWSGAEGISATTTGLQTNMALMGSAIATVRGAPHALNFYIYLHTTY